MSKLSETLYEYFKTEPRYIYSKDATTRSLEMDAVNELETSGKIVVKMRTIGYVIAEVS